VGPAACRTVCELKIPFNPLKISFKAAEGSTLWPFAEITALIADFKVLRFYIESFEPSRGYCHEKRLSMTSIVDITSQIPSDSTIVMSKRMPVGWRLKAAGSLPGGPSASTPK
jgi:hypothetical protein